MRDRKDKRSFSLQHLQVRTDTQQQQVPSVQVAWAHPLTDRFRREYSTALKKAGPWASQVIQQASCRYYGPGSVSTPRISSRPEHAKETRKGGAERGRLERALLQADAKSQPVIAVFFSTKRKAG